MRRWRTSILFPMLRWLSSWKKCWRIKSLPKLQLHHKQSRVESHYQQQAPARKFCFQRLRCSQHDVLVEMHIFGNVCRVVFLRDVFYVSGDDARTLCYAALRWLQNSIVCAGNSMDRCENFWNDSSSDLIWGVDRRVLHTVAGRLWIKPRCVFALRQQSNVQIYAASGTYRKSLFCLVFLPCVVLLHSTQSWWSQVGSKWNYSSSYCRKIH